MAYKSETIMRLQSLCARAEWLENNPLHAKNLQDSEAIEPLHYAKNELLRALRAIDNTEFKQEK